jgi:hypothetical protein
VPINYDSVTCDFAKHYTENDLYVRIMDCNKTLVPISDPFY